MRARRRTAGWRLGAVFGRPSARVRLAVVGAVLCTMAALPGQAVLATEASQVSGAPNAYAFAEGARRIEGARVTGDAVRLEFGNTYRSSLPRNGKIYYSLELDGTSNAYVSATAVPAPGSTVSVIDGVKVSVQNADGQSCSVETASFGAARSPHPVAAWGAREISPTKPLCQDAGTYYVAVERADPETSPPDAWDLELTAVSEPRLEKAGATSAPQVWDSASPEPLTGEAERRQGGGGFTRATPLGQGVWRGDIRAGQTLFYEVPVDWGQQLHAIAELGSSNAAGTGYTAGALDLALYNPVRDRIEDIGIGYDGTQKSGALAPLPPVAYENRHAVTGQVSGMRFAGSYYLVVHLVGQVADTFGDGPFALTLRVRVSGASQAGPGYVGESVPRGVFEVSERDREAAAEGSAGGDDTAMTAIAVGGIGTGSVLLVGLGVWTAVARRRAADWS